MIVRLIHRLIDWLIIRVNFSFFFQLDTQSHSHQTLLKESEKIRTDLEESRTIIASLAAQLTAEKDARTAETESFRVDLAEKETALQRLRQEAEESHNEKRLTSRMYQATLKVWPNITSLQIFKTRDQFFRNFF